MRVKKTVWTFFMIIMAAMLVLIVNSRIQLTSEIVVGGADGVFVKTNELENAMQGYTSSNEASANKYDDLEFPTVKISDWQYILINKDNALKAYTPNFKNSTELPLTSALLTR